MAKHLPMLGEKTVVDHITAGLGKIAAALRSQAWEGGTARKLTPTQGQILVLLAERATKAVRLNDVASELCLTAATVSDAVISLVEKKLVKKERSSEDQRALALTLTAAGRREAQQTTGWTQVVQAGVKGLTPDEQRAIFKRFSPEARPNSVAAQVLVQLAQSTQVDPAVAAELESVTLQEVRDALQTRTL